MTGFANLTIKVRYMEGAAGEGVGELLCYMIQYFSYCVRVTTAYLGHICI
jgi:hypothetical protein